MKSSAWIITSQPLQLQRGDVVSAAPGDKMYVATGKTVEGSAEIVSRRDILREMPYSQFRWYRRESSVGRLWRVLNSEKIS